jgi:hypothetical protein
VEPTAAGPLNLDRVCAWQEEMQRAVGRRDSLPAAACGAIAQLLERFLEEEAADDGRVDEVRAAIALLIVSSRRNSRLGGELTDQELHRLKTALQTVEQATTHKRTPHTPMPTAKTAKPY